MTDRYAALNDEIDRLREDPDFERDVAETARAFGPPPGPDVVDDSGHFTAQRVDDLLEDGKLREAAVMTAGKQLADSWPRQQRRPVDEVSEPEHPASSRG